jgi:hypothetical protein
VFDHILVSHIFVEQSDCFVPCHDGVY